MKKLLAALLVATAGMPASAAIIHYTLSGVTFDDGGTASGSFDYDADNAYSLNYDVTTSAASNSTGGVYSPGGTTNFSPNLGTFAVTENGPSGGYAHYLNLIFSSDLANGGISMIDASGASIEFQYSNGAARSVTGGSAIASSDVPEPAMLGLFGLGAVGLGLSRRRKTA